MAKIKPSYQELHAENQRLRAKLLQIEKAQKKHSIKWTRKLGIFLCVSLAGAILVMGNIIFWMGRTMIENDRYIRAVGPLIQEQSVQHAIAASTTNAIYSSVDLESLATSALPPRAEFLAGPLASQIPQFTNEQFQKVLATQKFQDIWINTHKKAHELMIEGIKKGNGDGVLSLNELYAQLSSSLQDTKLGFLAGRSLPSKAGNIQIVSVGFAPYIKFLLNWLTLIRIISVLLFAVLTMAAIWLAKKRRAMLIRVLIIYAILVFVSLLCFRLAREIIVSNISDVLYQQATNDAWQVFFSSLANQSFVIIGICISASLIIWLTGNSRVARQVRSSLQLAFSGKLHEAVFGKRQHTPGFISWAATYRRALQSGWLAIILLISLAIKITLANIIWLTISLLAGWLLIEFFAGPSATTADKRR